MASTRHAPITPPVRADGEPRSGEALDLEAYSAAYADPDALAAYGLPVEDIGPVMPIRTQREWAAFIERKRKQVARLFGEDRAEPDDDLDDIPPERITAALVDVQAKAQKLAARLLAAEAEKPRARTVAWAAAQSAMSKAFFYERADPRHPDHATFATFLKKRGRAVRVDEAGFWRWFRGRSR